MPYSRVLADPATKSLVEECIGINVWMDSGAYAITYPISGGKDLNVVLSHTTPDPVLGVQTVELGEVEKQYKHFDPRIGKVISMINHPVQRWPLLVTPPLESWSSACKRLALMGDAAHSMTNHMAQGAATAMEDGVFLGVVIKSVVEGLMTLESAVTLYEKERMPKAKVKQEGSNRNGLIMQASGWQAAIRDVGIQVEWRVPNLLGAKNIMRGVYSYDAAAHAASAVGKT